ncbi:hypothetical protein RJ639_034081 [Escallonia herrerae]|uniref:Uncharacterized protein n=1 Tax=Escallonia herrerae TaxID=1293975 RepID=A0AA88WU06_9ASTE|nr:hypothetical protein RJ639_034081 [Escallonia herrerae]
MTCRNENLLSAVDMVRSRSEEGCSPALLGAFTFLLLSKDYSEYAQSGVTSRGIQKVYMEAFQRAWALTLMVMFMASSQSGFTVTFSCIIANRWSSQDGFRGHGRLAGENDDHMTPEGGSPKGNNSSPESSKPTDTGSSKSHHKILGWREFRYILYRQEQKAEVKKLLRVSLHLKILYQAATGGSETNKQDGAVLESKPLGLKWAHPISSPEPGCVLVATEKLDGVRTFERTVVLLLRSGTRHPQEGPFGVVINRPLHKKIKDMKPTNVDLATTFADCSLHFGGPLEASMFLQRAGDKTQVSKFEEVIPGLCFGARNSLDEAAGLVKKGMLRPRDFRFFVGYAGWQLDQLREEIESDYWYVAACSANLIFGASSTSSSEGLWEEILQLMGGRYSELSRKPKQDI